MPPNPEANKPTFSLHLEQSMKTIVGSNARPLCRALFYTLILCISAFWALPRSARAQIYVSQEVSSSTGTVGEYDATTGAVINANLITGIIHPAGLVLSGNTLFVASAVANGGSVGTINATTGAPINANFLINGFNQPFALALSATRFSCRMMGTGSAPTTPPPDPRSQLLSAP
jgi:hypothetical protein